ncbi:ATP-dependent nuclease [Pantoea agglomerans]|uniref:ATP-dependent nuclease n=1 Tax=Enterobacter agglomerans TaxID=549 RepID=UPI003C79C9CD
MKKNIEVSVEKIIFSGGQTVNLNKNDKVIIVGPNNSGKSQTLREIIEIVSTDAINSGSVIKELKIKKTGDFESFMKFLNENAKIDKDSYYSFGRMKAHQSWLRSWVDQNKLTNIHMIFLNNITANERLNICNQIEHVHSETEIKKPQHSLYDNPDLLAKISSLFKKAFGKDLVLNYRGGRFIPIHVGEKPIFDRFVDSNSNEYVEKVVQYPLLEKQGDGVKSYAGILFESIVQEFDVTLIDEPEAFLHPPQMKLLGETLSSEVKGQLFIATHSSDILRGFLEGTKGNIRILRIQRENDINTIFEADADAVKELWNKPNLRFSNALDGIFHEQVIICEDHSDCRLYNYTAEWVKTKRDENWLDTSYIPSGGKAGISGIASVLNKIGVPVKAIFDFDFLSSEELIKTTVYAFGGDVEEIIKIWRRVDAFVRKGVKPKSNKEIKDAIHEILNESEPDILNRSAITSTLKQGQSWSMLKLTGKAGLPPGDAYNEYCNLIEKLEDVGIYIVPVGEVEMFNKKITGHGPKFVSSVLTDHSLESEDFDELRKFVERVHSGPHSKHKQVSTM